MRKPSILFAAAASLAAVLGVQAQVQVPAERLAELKGDLKAFSAKTHPNPFVAKGDERAPDLGLDHGVRYVPSEADLGKAAFTLIWLQRDGRVSGDILLKYKGRETLGRFETKLQEKRKWGETYYYKDAHPVVFRVAWQGLEHSCRSDIWMNVHPKSGADTMLLQGSAPAEIESLDLVQGCRLGAPAHQMIRYVRDSIQPRGKDAQ